MSSPSSSWSDSSSSTVPASWPALQPIRPGRGIGVVDLVLVLPLLLVLVIGLMENRIGSAPRQQAITIAPSQQGTSVVKVEPDRKRLALRRRATHL
jgi:hypothetical protein